MFIFLKKGGHGYHAYSSIPSLTNSFAVGTTGGGDNYVLTQQCASYLLKSFQQIVNEKKAEGDSINYFQDFKYLKIQFKF